MGKQSPSLADIARGRTAQPPPAPRRRVTLPDADASAVTIPPEALPDMASVFAGLAGLEQAAASLRAGIMAIRQVPVAQSSGKISPLNLDAGDGRIGYRLPEAAKALGVSAKVLRREVAAGRIPHRLCGRATIISKAALDAYARGESGG